jgi:hypothetical protein
MWRFSGRDHRSSALTRILAVAAMTPFRGAAVMLRLLRTSAMAILMEALPSRRPQDPYLTVIFKKVVFCATIFPPMREMA